METQPATKKELSILDDPLGLISRTEVFILPGDIFHLQEMGMRQVAKLGVAGSLQVILTLGNFLVFFRILLIDLFYIVCFRLYTSALPARRAAVSPLFLGSEGGGVEKSKSKLSRPVHW